MPAVLLPPSPSILSLSPQYLILSPFSLFLGHILVAFEQQHYFRKLRTLVLLPQSPGLISTMTPTDQGRHLRDSSETHTHSQAAQPHQETPAADSINENSELFSKPVADKGLRFTDSIAASNDHMPSQPVNTDAIFDAVTPGFELVNNHHGPDSRAESPSYFSNADPRIPETPHQESHRPIPSLGQPSFTMNRRESLSEIRAANPDLSLSGNIISATFTPTHAFSYRKGGQWVSKHAPLR